MDKVISFNCGIRRHPSIGVDGELSELVNLIPKNGELVNVKPMKVFELKDMAGTLVYTHSASAGKNYISVRKVTLEGVGVQYTLYYTRYKDHEYIEDGVVMSLMSEPKSVTSVGNVLIVSSESRLDYALWKDGKYSRTRINDIGFDISITGKTVLDGTSYEAPLDKKEFPYYIGTTSLDASSKQMSIIYSLADSLVNEAINDTNIAGKCFKYITVGLAVMKMFDDSYIACSNFFTLDPMTSKHGMNAVVFYSEDDKGLAVRVKPSLQEFEVSVKASDITEEEKSLIKSVDIYLSRPTTFIDLERGGVFNLQNEEVFYLKDKEGIEKEIADMVFYKSHSVDIGKVKDGYTIALTAVSGVEERLRLSDIASFTFSSNVMFSYNSRLHVAGVKSTPIDMSNVVLNQKSRQKEGDSKGYYNRVSDAYSYTGSFTFNEDLKVEAVIEVDVNDPNTGLYTNRMYTTLQYPLPPILSYPSMYATEMRLYIVRQTGSNTLYKSFSMKPHNYGNISFAVNADSDGLSYTQAYKREIGTNTVTSSLQWDIYDGDFSELSNNAKRGETIEERSNILKYSHSGNPFVFPALNTVAVGDGDIIGLSTSAKAVSQGQFGQFPLYTFCTDGVWALNVSSDGSYSARQPISRDVCVNSDSITQIDGAVVFVTDQGLKLVQGSEVVLLSSNMNGSNVDEKIYFKPKFFSSYGHAVFDELVVSESRDFRDIIKDSRIAYDYPNSLLRIFPKESTGKYYVFDLTTREFGSVVDLDDKTSITSIILDYPTPLVCKGRKVYTFESTSEDNPIRYGLLLTRPITFGEPFALKKLHDIKLHYTKLSENSKNRMVIYGSNNMADWWVVPSLRMRSFKYYRLAIVTQMTDYDSLSGMIIRYELERTNKLR